MIRGSIFLQELLAQKGEREREDSASPWAFRKEPSDPFLDPACVITSSGLDSTTWPILNPVDRACGHQGPSLKRTSLWILLPVQVKGNHYEMSHFLSILRGCTNNIEQSYMCRSSQVIVYHHYAICRNDDADHIFCFRRRTEG